MNDTVRYKRFNITLKVELEASGQNRYQMLAQIRPIDDEPEQPALHFSFTSNFASPQAAYAFGLREAFAWIDEHEWDESCAL